MLLPYANNKGTDQPAGLSLPRSGTPKTGFLVTRLTCIPNNPEWGHQKKSVPYDDSDQMSHSMEKPTKWYMRLGFAQSNQSLRCVL